MQGDRRQLAAVMLTDMVGFSSLAQRHEALALDLARELESLTRVAVESRGGRAVKSLGDGLLVEFANALDAVTCALEVHDALRTRNSTKGGEEVVVRIGVHLGDVVHRDGDIFGDAVNLVSRIEPHAPAGGVCISRQVYDQVRNKLEATFRSIGEPPLKNIDEPIQLFVVTPVTGPGRPGPGPRASGGEELRRIVVLPFANISPDPRDEYFADGMTEELIEKLAHVKGLRVIARTTAMHYKDSSMTAMEIGRTLNVGLVLEASVRKAAGRVRITAQLIETGTEEHLWSSRYDRELDDIFAIQDDISDSIATAITEHAVSLGDALELSAPSSEGDTANMEAYTDFLQGRELYRRRLSESSMRRALELFESAVERDPAFARARVGVADSLMWLGGEGYAPYVDSNERAKRELSKALATNESIAEAHSSLSGMLLSLDDDTGSAREARRAIELNPSFSDPYRWLAQIEAGRGHIDEAVRLLEEAYALDPLDINVIAFLGRAYFYAGRVAKALDFWQRTEPMVEFRVNQHRSEYYLSRQDYVLAERGIATMERLRPGNFWNTMLRGVLAARTGDDDGARDSIASLEVAGDDGAVATFLRGFVHFALGEMEEFWECMDRSLEMHSLPLLELMYSPLLEDLRADPRFHDLLRRQREQRIDD